MYKKDVKNTNVDFHIQEETTGTFKMRVTRSFSICRRSRMASCRRPIRCQTGNRLIHAFNPRSTRQHSIITPKPSNKSPFAWQHNLQKRDKTTEGNPSRMRIIKCKQIKMDVTT